MSTLGSPALPPTEAGANPGLTIGEYLIRRLQAYGIGHVFGVPGDYILTLYGMLEKSPIQTIGCTREDCAGFAADAYARIHGMGAVCVTYCVGGLSVCNAIAGAYAEKSPVVMITGSPGLRERTNNPLLHHKVRDFRTQMEVFEKLCVAGTEITDPVTAFREIDRVLAAAARFKRPVYLDIPRDMVAVVPHIAHSFHETEVVSDPHATAEAVAETVGLLQAAQRPVVVAGVEIHRFGLQDQLIRFVESTQVPVAATILGKSVVAETHPLYVGLYEGAMGHSNVAKFVEESDLVLLLGTFMTDLNLGIYTANLDPARCVYATSEQLRIRHHHYHGVSLGTFLDALISASPTAPPRELPPKPALPEPTTDGNPAAAVTIDRLIAELNRRLDDRTVIIADVGDALFAASELVTRVRTDFLGPAYYTSMGFSVPAAVGAHCAQPDKRVVVLVGDGGFQMTGMELSTIVRNGFTPIVILLDNRGYGTERALHPGEWEYNEIHPWKYHKLPEVLGGGVGHEVRSVSDFEQALATAWDDRQQMHLFQVHLDPADASQTLRRLAERLGQRV